MVAKKKKTPAPPPPTLGQDGVRSFTTDQLIESFHRPLWRDIAITAQEQAAEAIRKQREGRTLVGPAQEYELTPGEWD